MKRHCLVMRKLMTRTIIYLVLASMTLLPAQVSLARGPGHGGRGGGGRPPVYKPGGGYVKHLPRGASSITVKGGGRYSYYGGHFYRPGPYGHRRVRAPYGAVVGRLPLGFATLMLAGVLYYTYLGVYYRPAPGGFVVVQPPSQVVVTAPPVVASDGIVQPSTSASGNVSVIAQSLNVRSGPGGNFPVIAVVYNGNNLVVQGMAPGWYYVWMPSGGYGWVSSQFTTPLRPPAGSPSG